MESKRKEFNFKPNENFIFYLYWICERQSIFWKRLKNEEYPWTDDVILRDNKFTNVYRIQDRESQFLISNVIYNERGINNDYDSEDIFWRILLFRHFNKTETWKLLEDKFGDITLDVKFDDIIKFLDENKDVYNKAYMLTSSFTRKSYSEYAGMNKYHAYFEIFRREIFNNGYIYEILSAKSLEDLYNKLRKITAFGEFISMQLAIDLNYSLLFNFDENDFIKAGLGAIRGIERTFKIGGKPNYEEIIKWVHDNLDNLFEEYKEYGFVFEPIPNRKPTLIDLQNCFCETGKYLKTLSPNKDKDGEYHMSHKYYNKNKPSIEYAFPSKWQIPNINLK